MKHFEYLVLGFIVFWAVLFLSVNVGNPGPGSIEPVVSAIALLCAIVVICTVIIVNTIKNINNK